MPFNSQYWGHCSPSQTKIRSRTLDKLNAQNSMKMGVGRRVWIRRSTGSATLISCLDDAVVDELRDSVVLKFANSLGRRFDSPDIVITITPRVGTDVQTFPERRLSPNEVLSSVLDAYYPGGQTIQEALIADVLMSRIAEWSTRRPGCCDCYMRPDEYSSYPFRTSAPAAGTTISETDADSSSNPILTTAETSPLSSYGIGERCRDDSPGLLRQAYNLGGGWDHYLLSFTAGIMTVVHRLSYIYPKPKTARCSGSDRANVTSTSSRSCNARFPSRKKQGSIFTSSVRQPH